MIIVIPFNQAYRNAARSSTAALSPTEAFATMSDILKQTLTSHSGIAILPTSIDYLLQRIREIDSPAIILQRTPTQIAFLAPVDLVEAPVAGIVPRAVWPGKPILVPGYQFSQQYYGLGDNVYSSSAITQVGDLYRYGGWAPVILGMFLLGCLVRLLDDILDIRHNPQAIFLVLLLLPTLVKNEVGWVPILAGIPATLIVWTLTVAITFRPRRAT